jgi:hypothetical protein
MGGGGGGYPKLEKNRFLKNRKKSRINYHALEILKKSWINYHACPGILKIPQSNINMCCL